MNTYALTRWRRDEGTGSSDLETVLTLVICQRDTYCGSFKVSHALFSTNLVIYRLAYILVRTSSSAALLKLSFLSNSCNMGRTWRISLMANRG